MMDNKKGRGGSPEIFIFQSIFDLLAVGLF